jgi:hypothetical protein
MLHKASGNDALSKMTYEWHKCFQSTRTSTDERFGQLSALRKNSFSAQMKDGNPANH